MHEKTNARACVRACLPACLPAFFRIFCFSAYVSGQDNAARGINLGLRLLRQGVQAKIGVTTGTAFAGIVGRRGARKLCHVFGQVHAQVHALALEIEYCISGTI